MLWYKAWKTPQVSALPGSSLHQVWQAVRASSAAPYYLDDFKCGADRCEGLGLLARVAGTCQYSSLLRPTTWTQRGADRCDWQGDFQVPEPLRTLPVQVCERAYSHALKFQDGAAT